MKQLLEFAKSQQTLLIAAGICALVFVMWVAISEVSSRIAERRVNKLEAEKQQLLKKVDEARDRDLILQGKIEAKNEVIQRLSSHIAESNQRVTNAHNETVTAKSNLIKVRADGPRFTSNDDAGRVRELGTDLHGLYPDSP